MNRLTPLALAIGLAPLAVHAGPTDLDAQLKLSDTVVSAARLPQTRSEATSLTSVYTREDIERLQPLDLLDLLKRVPGLQVARNGGRGSGPTGIYLRGTKSAQTLVLIDGQRLNGASDGAARLEFLSLEQIERIEVARGANSVLYGSEAMGGVIQIFTRRSQGEGLHPRLRLAYGSRNSWERSAGISGGDENTRFALNLSDETSNGIDRTDGDTGADTDHDAYRNHSVSLNVAQTFGERLQAGFSLLDQRGETEYDLSWTGASYPYDKFELKSYSGYADFAVNDRWQSRLELGHTEDRRFNRADDLRLTGSTSTYRDGANWLNDLTLNEQHSLTVGAEWYEDQLHSDTAYDQESRWNQAAYVQHRFNAAAFSTELGVRHDKNEQYGSDNTWRGALTVPMTDRHQWVLAYSEGFRTPTFADLYYPGFSNPNLRPEHSKSYELQLRSLLSQHTRFEAAIYRTDLEDAIGLDATWTPQNIDQARINGFEAAIAHQAGPWHGELGASFIDPRDRDTGKTLARRARRTLNLDIDRQLGNDFAVGGSWLLVSRAYDNAANTRELPGHGILSLRGSWQALDDLQLGLKLHNVLDKHYVNARYSGTVDYVEEGRTAMLALTWTPSL